MKHWCKVSIICHRQVQTTLKSSRFFLQSTLLVFVASIPCLHINCSFSSISVLIGDLHVNLSVGHFPWHIWCVMGHNNKCYMKQFYVPWLRITFLHDHHWPFYARLPYAWHPGMLSDTLESDSGSTVGTHNSCRRSWESDLVKLFHVNVSLGQSFRQI